MFNILADIPVEEAARGEIEARHGVRILPASEADAADMEGAAALICGALPAYFDAMRSLRLIQLYSVGFTQLHGRGLVQQGVRVCNARGVYDTTIAEWNIAMMINLARDLRCMIRQQEQGLWQRDEPRFQSAVRGRTLGIWGYGGIGRETARLARALGMTVHVMTRAGISPRTDFYTVPGTGDPDGRLPDRVFVQGEAGGFLRDLDFLVLAMPQSAENIGIVGERELRAMKPTAFLLNPARGPLVQEEALIRALNERWIAGAALDTHHHYPMPPDHPLWKMPHVILTPHISGSDKSPHFLDRVWDLAAQNITRFLAGKPLWNELIRTELEP